MSTLKASLWVSILSTLGFWYLPANQALKLTLPKPRSTTPTDQKPEPTEAGAVEASTTTAATSPPAPVQPVKTFTVQQVLCRPMRLNSWSVNFLGDAVGEERTVVRDDDENRVIQPIYTWRKPDGRKFLEQVGNYSSLVLYQETEEGPYTLIQESL